MLNNLKSRMTYANAASTIALVIAVGSGGAAVAAGLVPAGSVGTKQIVNGAIRAADMHGGAVTGPKIRKGAVSGPKIRDGAIANPRVFGAGNLGVVRGYAWNDTPDADADLTDLKWTYNRSGGPVTVVREQTGEYVVTFAGLNLDGGMFVVDGYGSGPAWCKIGGWSANTARVLCFDPAGQPVDSNWVITAID